jgi:hypothetical protein
MKDTTNPMHATRAGAAILALLALPLACASVEDDASSTASAIRTKHVLVVGPLTSASSGDGDTDELADGGASDARERTPEVDGGDNGAGPAAHDDESDDVTEPDPGERIAPDGAALRHTRMLLTKPACVLGAGAYDLTQAPRRSEDGVFWHVIFAKEPRGLGDERCGTSGWVVDGTVAFRRFETADDPAPSPSPSSVDGCGPDRSFRPSWVKPVRGPITGRYGDCRDGCRRRHAGLDIAASSGTPLVAAERGQVIDARTGVGACGTVIEIRHPNGASTRFCHNKRLLVRKGACVARGQQIAEVGNTGIGTGPHMHMEYYPSPTGGAVDPRATFGY